MNQVTHSLPLQNSSAGPVIETRPLHVEEWLNSLPYTAFEKASRLLEEATRATNQVDLKPGVRLELVELYHRPYQFYADTQIKMGSHHTAQSIELVNTQTRILGQIACNLGNACKLIAKETAGKKSKPWSRSRPLPRALLAVVNYLAHELIFSYLQYAPAPERIWRQLNQFYKYAEANGLAQEPVRLFGGKHDTTIETAYKRAALTTLQDPYHLPYGAIWEVFNQLDEWCDLTRIGPFTPAGDPDGKFVIDLDSGTRPQHLNLFHTSAAGAGHRLLETGDVCRVINRQLQLIRESGRTDESIRISPNISRLILTRMSISLGMPSQRSTPRAAGQGRLNLVFGLNAVYFHVNGKEEFTVPAPSSDEHEVTDHLFTLPETGNSPPEYPIHAWDLIDMGPEGFSAQGEVEHAGQVRVGDLIAMSRRPPADITATDWSLGVIRWMMVSGGRHYRLGIQTIAADVYPAAIRAVRGSPMDCRFRRALTAGGPAAEGHIAVITGPGLFQTKRKLELKQGEQQLPARTGTLAESLINFEHFTVRI